MLIELLSPQRPTVRPHNGLALAASRLPNRRVLSITAAGLVIALLAHEYAKMPGKTVEARNISLHSPARADSIGVFSFWRHEPFTTIDTEGRKRAMWQPLMTIIPALRDGQSWANARYPGFAQMTKEERSFVEEVTSSFVRKRPAALLVDVDPPTPSMRGFDYVDYFRADARSQEAIAEYEFAEQTAHFRVYRRRDAFPRTKTVQL